MTNISIRITWGGRRWMVAALAAVMATNAGGTLGQAAAPGLVVRTDASGPLAGAELAAGRGSRTPCSRLPA